MGEGRERRGAAGAGRRERGEVVLAVGWRKVTVEHGCAASARVGEAAEGLSLVSGAGNR